METRFTGFQPDGHGPPGPVQPRCESHLYGAIEPDQGFQFHDRHRPLPGFLQLAGRAGHRRHRQVGQRHPEFPEYKPDGEYQPHLALQQGPLSPETGHQIPEHGAGPLRRIRRPYGTAGRIVGIGAEGAAAGQAAARRKGGSCFQPGQRDPPARNPGDHQPQTGREGGVP